MSSKQPGMNRRQFLEGGTVAALASAGGLPVAAKTAFDPPSPPRVEDIRSSNPHGGQLLAHALKREGVSKVFTLCGGHIMHLYDGCIDEGIDVIDTRHEAAAAHMAEAFSLVSGGVGVVAVTAGPGMTNAVTGVANAYENGVPMLVLGGHSSVVDNDIGSLQDIDQMDLYESITKWSRVCYETDRIPEYVAMAFRYALSGRPAPVYLELPQDVIMGKVDKSEVNFPTNYRSLDRPRGSRDAIEAAAKILAQAQRPLLIAGTGCLWSQAGEEIAAFAERIGAPIITHAGGRGIVPDSHPLSLYPASMGQMGPAIVQADAVLLLGVRLDFMLGYGKPFLQSGKLIQVDIEPTRLGFNRGADCSIFGDVRQVLAELVTVVPERGNRSWVEQVQQTAVAMGKKDRAKMDLESSPVHPRRLAEEVRDFFGGEAAYIVDGGYTSLWAAETLPAERPASLLGTLTGPMGCLGVGLPFALATKVAQPERTVVLLSGDGAFGLNAVEIDTAVRHDVPVVCVVANDGAWGMIKAAQAGMFGKDRVIASQLEGVRYDRWAQGFGGYGERVERPQDIRPALERALKSGKPALVDVATLTVPRMM